MRGRQLTTTLAAMALLALPACGDDDSQGNSNTDGAVTPDSSTQHDAGVQPDGAPIPDAAPLPDAGPCPATLAERVTVTPVDVAPSSVDLQAGGYFSSHTPPILAATATGASPRVAWTDNAGAIHVTPLDATDDRAGVDVTLPGNELRGFAVYAGGYGVLLQRGTDVMALVSHDSMDTPLFDIEIVGNVDHGITDAKYVRTDWGDYGRLAHNGSSWVTYFGHAMNWGSSGEHQGDLLWYFDATGTQESGGWGWGCSHSLDVRLAISGATVGPVCLADCYPEKAVLYNHNTQVYPEPSGNCSGSSSGELGGLTPLPGGGGNGDFVLTFVSGEGRSSRDVAFVQILGGTVGTIVWLTDTPGIDESAVQVAPYGGDLFVTWQSDAERLAAVTTTTGTVLLGPEPIPAEAGLKTDLINLSGGDVGWAHVWGGNQTVQIVRVRLCQ